MIKYTRFQLILEILSLVLLLASLVIFFANWRNLPGQVPVHFDLQGIPDRLGSRMELLVIPGIGVFIYMILSLVRFIPCRFWNTPWRVNEANRTFVYSTSFSLIQLVKLEITIFWSFTSCYSSIMQAPPRVLLFLFPITLVATIVIVYVVTTIQCYQHRSY